MARFYSEAAPGQEPDYDVVIAVLPREDGSVPYTVADPHGEWLPLHHILEVVHHEPNDHLDDARSALRRASQALGYTPSGPLTEVDEVTAAVGAPPDALITRIRLPYAH